MSTYCNLAEERAALQAAVTAKLEMTLGDPSKYELVQNEVDELLEQLEALDEEEDEQDRANGLELSKEYVSSSPLPAIPEADEDYVSDFSLMLSQSDSESHSDGEASSEGGSESSDEDAGTPMLFFRNCKVEDCKLCKGKYQPKGY
ncbi:hypothetical protein HFD88_004520 [Aspergillus terreus]|nr:hypothetical protein HFD88_004520 [Aspergillus terreus]